MQPVVEGSVDQTPFGFNLMTPVAVQADAVFGPYTKSVQQSGTVGIDD